jgi:hypothetical protein
MKIKIEIEIDTDQDRDLNVIEEIIAALRNLADKMKL